MHLSQLLLRVAKEEQKNDQDDCFEPYKIHFLASVVQLIS